MLIKFWEFESDEIDHHPGPKHSKPKFSFFLSVWRYFSVPRFFFSMPGKVINVGSMSTPLSKYFVCRFENLAVRCLLMRHSVPFNFGKVIWKHEKSPAPALALLLMSKCSSLINSFFFLLWLWRATCGCRHLLMLNPKENRAGLECGERRQTLVSCSFARWLPRTLAC